MTDLGKLPPAQLEQLTSIPKAKAFLGREFLTWLWFLADTTDKELEYQDKATGKKKRFDLWIDDRLVLESGQGLSHENVLKGGDPSNSQEAGMALATGKTVRELRLGVHIKGVGDFTAVLNEGDLNPRSLKLPTVETGEAEGSAEPTLPIATRLKQTEAFLTILDRLFAMFMEQRVGDDWESEHLPRIRAWVKKRQHVADAATLH
jgi:hypothetical protein